MPGSEVPFKNPVFNEAEALRIAALQADENDVINALGAAYQHIWDAAGVVWTRVEDGLPVPGREVQLTVQYANGGREVRGTRYLSPYSGWEGVGTYVRPLAWAPLPEPWRG